MNGVKRILLWFALINKRLWKKISFLCILGCSPFLVMGVNLMSGQDSGMLRIVLAQEADEDEKAEELISALTEQDSVLQFIKVESVDEAYHLVQSGNADAAWIFHEDMEKQIKQYVGFDSDRNPIVTIVEKEDNVMLHLSREKLFGVLHQAFVYAQYEQYVTEKLLPDQEVSEEELQKRYEETDVQGNLFVLKYLDGKVEKTELSYFTLPVRGFLSLVIVLCGLANCMFFIQDKEKGMFTWLPVNGSVLWSWGYLLPGLLNTGLVVLISLRISESFTAWANEIVLMVLFLIMTAGFCDVIRRLTGSLVRMGALIPVILLVMLALCPIFMGVYQFKAIQLLLPPYYYLNALHNTTYVLGMVVYIGVVYVIDYLLLRYWERNKLLAAMMKNRVD